MGAGVGWVRGVRDVPTHRSCRVRFACAPVVRALVVLLRGYPRNSPRTNHCAARLLHRLARELRVEGLLFQLSLFALFHRLFRDPAAGAHQVSRRPPPARRSWGGLCPAPAAPLSLPPSLPPRRSWWPWPSSS